MALRIGRYLLHDEIAAGGMASVHFGRLVSTGGFAKTVAIKRLHRQLAREEAFRTMILEEARLAARIRHPNVVPPLDVLAEGGELLLVMEYVHGEALSKLMRVSRETGERIPVAVAAAVMSNVLHGLHAAHEARGESGEPLGIVHRDVSPQNVIVGVDGVARVIDFGIAKAVTSGENTNTGTVKGKLPYLSPEQLEGEPVTRRTDIYAAAVVFWEVLAGKRLFDGTDDSMVLRNIMSYEVPAPSRHNPTVPGVIDDLILRALAKRPSERFSTAREMALALEEAITIATPSVVGSWTERLAEELLAQRAALISRLEKEEVEDEPASSVPPPTSRRPASVPPPAPTSRAPAALARSLGPPPSAPPPSPPASRRISHPDAESTLTRPLSRPSIPSMPPPELHPPAAGVLRKPEVEIPNVAWLPPSTRGDEEPTRKKPWVLFFLGSAFLLLVLLTPALLRRLFVALAARHAVVLTVDRVEVSRRSLRLVDVHAESPDLTGVSVRAGSVTLGGFLFPKRIDVDDLVAQVDGSLTDVALRVDAFRAAHAAALQDQASGIESVAVSSGRIVWKDAVATGTSLVAENLSLDADRAVGRPLFDDLRAHAPLVTVRVGPDVVAGPWLLELERKPPLTRAILRFDPMGSYVGSATWSASDDGALAISFAMPPARPSELRLPTGAFGPAVTGSARIEMQGELSFVAALGAPGAGPGPRAASGHLVLAIANATPFPATPPATPLPPGVPPPPPRAVDLAVDIPVAGDPAKPLSLSAATLAYGATDPNGNRAVTSAAGRLEGTLDATTRGAPRIVLAGSTAALPCLRGGETSLAVDVDVTLDRLRTAKVDVGATHPCEPRLR